jgi:undecaprenyl pyrophosphate synthase
MTKNEALRRGEIGNIAVPRHVAVIMGGNARWAAARGLPPVKGRRPHRDCATLAGAVTGYRRRERRFGGSVARTGS